MKLILSIVFIFTLAANVVATATTNSDMAELCKRALDLGSTVDAEQKRQPIYGRRNLETTELKPFAAPKPIGLVSIVVPVYKELYNENIVRFIRNISRQSLAPGKIEVVFIVNNNPVIAADKTNPIYLENQETLTYLANIKVPFHKKVIDLSTGGLERNMGKLRNVGINAALEGTTVNPYDHVIVSLDADTTILPDYLKRLVDYYENYPTDAIISEQKFSVDDTQNLSILNSHYRYGLDQADAQNWLTLTYANHGAGGPQVSARVSTINKYGMYPELVLGEDYAFWQRLRWGTYILAHDLSIFSQDRARADGFDAALRLAWEKDPANLNLKNKPVINIYERHFEPRSSHYDNLVVTGALSTKEAAAKLEGELAEVLGHEVAIFKKSHEFEEFLKAKNAPADVKLSSFISREIFDTSAPGDFLITMLKRVATPAERANIENLVEQIKTAHALRLNLRRKILHQLWTNDHRIDIVSPDTDFFSSLLTDPKSALRVQIAENKKQGRDERTFMNEIEDLFPDWLKEFNDTPYFQQVKQMQLVAELYVAAHNFPERWPALSRFIERYYRPPGAWTFNNG